MLKQVVSAEVRILCPRYLEVPSLSNRTRFDGLRDDYNTKVLHSIGFCNVITNNSDIRFNNPKVRPSSARPASQHYSATFFESFHMVKYLVKVRVQP